MILKDQLKSLSKTKNMLQKKDDFLIVTDFDDTIFSRKEQLENDENYVKLRGNYGNEYTRDVLGIDNFIKLYYIGKIFPKTISKQLRENHDLILTAGFKDIQEAKLKTTKLDHINNIIVYNSKDKSYELVKYIIENLKFIPSEIIIYEDKIENFQENKKEIEEFLGTKLKIMFVKLISNDKNPVITEIK